jgi:hypothetical protein
MAAILEIPPAAWQQKSPLPGTGFQSANAQQLQA